MSILAKIAEQAQAKGLPFLVIGGNAVIAYGYPRSTIDIDLLVREGDRRAWDTLISSLGYLPHQIARAFHMYTPLNRGGVPVDLMLVDESTFEKLSREPKRHVLDETMVSLPRLSHLLALKLHALRSGQPHRFERDISDVVVLLQANHVDLAQEEYASMLERYATPAVRDEIFRRLDGPEPPGA